MVASRVNAVCLAFVLLGLSSGAAQAQVVTEFSSGITAGAQPFGITAGPDGNLWFTESGGNRIAMINPTTHVITEFSLGGSPRGPQGIAAGSDGNLWFTESGSNLIGQINPTTHVITEFSGITGVGVTSLFITAGPDGNLWFTEPSTHPIGMINPTTHVVTEFSAGLTPGAIPFGITAGPDGNLWFVEFNSDRIGMINPTTHVITEFSTGMSPGAGPWGITAGPDGNLWFTEQSLSKIGMINPTTHVITEFSTLTPNAGPDGIAAGPDGNLWFAEFNGNRIGRINPTTHVVSEFIAPGSPQMITAGPDGNLWFTLNADAVGQITTGAATLPPTIAKSFGAGSIPVSGSTSLTFTLTNPNVGSGLTGVGFTDNLPAGLVVATPNGQTGSCGPGTITATAGSGSVSLSGANLAGSASCTFGVNVTGTTVGVKNNVSGAVTSTEGGTGGTASASVTVFAIAPPTIGKSFGAATIPLNGTTSLGFTISNPNASTALTAVGFTDTLPAGLIVSTPNGLTGSCGAGVITATAGSGTVSLAGATLAATASCTFSVNVTGTAVGTQDNVSGAVTSAEGGSGGTALASVTVVPVGPPVASIPTLKPWALCLLGLLLIVAASIVLRAHGIG